MLYLSLFTVPLSFNIQPPKIYLHYHSFYFFLLPPLLFSSWLEALTLHVHLQLRCRNLAHIALFSQSIRLEIYKKGTFFLICHNQIQVNIKESQQQGAEGGLCSGVQLQSVHLDTWCNTQSWLLAAIEDPSFASAFCSVFSTVGTDWVYWISNGNWHEIFSDWLCNALEIKVNQGSRKKKTLKNFSFLIFCSYAVARNTSVVQCRRKLCVKLWTALEKWCKNGSYANMSWTTYSCNKWYVKIVRNCTYWWW